MPTLNWIGKESVVNHDKEVPFRLLKKVKSLSVGESSQNLIIHGDNLEDLKALMPYYCGKIKCIYIDPPYNTGNEHWIYNDKVNSPKIRKWLGKVVGKESEDLCRHDKWLCMLYPRLKLLKEFLTSDGVIFISIDDNEFATLKLLCDDIFGDQNYENIFNIKVRHENRILRQDIRYQQSMEYLLCYAKQKSSYQPSRREKVTEEYKDYIYDVQLLGKPKIVEIGGYTVEVYKRGDYKIVIADDGKGQFKRYSIRGSLITQKGSASEYFEKYLRSRLHQDEFGALYKVIGMGLKGDGLGYRYIIQPEKDNIKNGAYFQGNPLVKKSDLGLPFPNFFDFVYQFNNVGYEGEVEFKTGKKPLEFLKLIFKLANISKDDLIMDSFAGSGSTAHAVLDLNKEDGGNRKFILVEIEDKVAKDITAERVKRAIEKFEYKDGFEFCELEKPLFDGEGKIDEECSFEQLATYIFFTETQTNINKNKIEKPFIGESENSEIYLIFREKGKNVLDRAFLKKLRKNKNKKIIYADRCLIDERMLERQNIQFKQIPYEVKVY